MFVDTCELDVRLCRTRDDQAVDETLRDGFSHRMPQQTLYNHRSSLHKQSRIARARHVRKRRILQSRRGCRGDTQHLTCPAVDCALQLRCDVLRIGRVALVPVPVQY